MEAQIHLVTVKSGSETRLLPSFPSSLVPAPPSSLPFCPHQSGFLPPSPSSLFTSGLQKRVWISFCCIYGGRLFIPCFLILQVHLKSRLPSHTGCSGSPEVLGIWGLYNSSLLLCQAVQWIRFLIVSRAKFLTGAVSGAKGLFYLACGVRRVPTSMVRVAKWKPAASGSHGCRMGTQPDHGPSRGHNDQWPTQSDLILPADRHLLRTPEPWEQNCNQACDQAWITFQMQTITVSAATRQGCHCLSVEDLEGWAGMNKNSGEEWDQASVSQFGLSHTEAYRAKAAPVTYLSRLCLSVNFSQGRWEDQKVIFLQNEFKAGLDYMKGCHKIPKSQTKHTVPNATTVWESPRPWR